MKRVIPIALGKLAEIVASMSDPEFRVGVHPENKAKETEPLELLVHGYIGDPWEGLDSGSVLRLLKANKDRPVNVLINSAGGLVYDGIAIHNALAAHPAPTSGMIQGIAGSAATIISQGVDKLAAYDNTTFFVHKALGIAVGNDDVMEDMADHLRTINEAIITTYAAKTGQSRQTLARLITGKVDGTTMSAREAKDYGFIDEIVSRKGEAAASDGEPEDALDPSRFEAAMRVAVRKRLAEVTDWLDKEVVGR